MATSPSISTFNYSPVAVPIFEGENYNFWSIQMRTFFISQDLWDLVENSYESPKNQEECSAWSEERKKKLKEHEMKDAKALYCIHQAISKAIAPRIMAATKSKEAWEILKNEFQGPEKVIDVKLHSLWREFDNLMMKEGESIQIFFSRVFTIINQIKSCGATIEDKRVTEKVLRSLPIKYDHAVAAIEEQKNLSTLSLHELLDSLQVHEERMNRFSEQPLEQAYQTKMNMSEKKDGENKKQNQGNQFQRTQSNRGRGRGGNRFSVQPLEQAYQTKMNMSEKKDGENKKQNQGNQFQRTQFNRGRGRGGNRYTQATARGKSKFESPCKFCKKTNHESMDCYFKKCTRCKNPNHLEKDCWFRKKDEANISEKGESSNQQKTQDTWYIDSRCSNRMTGNKSSDFSLDEGVKSKVKLGDGKFQNIEGKGNIALQTKGEKGESSNQKEAQDTWYIDGNCNNRMMGNKSSVFSLDEGVKSKVKLGDGKFQNIEGKGNIAVQTKGAMEASTSSEVNFQIPSNSLVPHDSVPSEAEVESTITGFRSYLESEAGSEVGSFPLISSLDGSRNLYSVRHAFNLMDTIKPIQVTVKAATTNKAMREAFLNVGEVAKFLQQL